MRYLIGDLKAVLDHLGTDKASIIGHDWESSVDDHQSSHPENLADNTRRVGPATSGRDAANSCRARRHPDQANESEGD